MDTGDKLLALDDAMAFDNGEAVAFTIKTATGKHLRVNCSLPELSDMFSYLGHLAKAASEQQNAPTSFNPDALNELAPIPAQGIGFQAGRNLNETLLVVRLFGFLLAFAVPSSGLASMADELVQIVRTLSAGGEQIH